MGTQACAAICRRSPGETTSPSGALKVFARRKKITSSLRRASSASGQSRSSAVCSMPSRHCSGVKPGLRNARRRRHAVTPNKKTKRKHQRKKQNRGGGRARGRARRPRRAARRGGGGGRRAERGG